MTTKLETRRGKSSRDDREGYIVSVMGGPQSLLWRLTEKAALEDGATYVERYWELTADGWRAK